MNRLKLFATGKSISVNSPPETPKTVILKNYRPAGKPVGLYTIAVRCCSRFQQTTPG